MPTMIHLVAEMGQQGAAGTDPAGGVDRLRHIEVRVVRGEAQCVDHQQFHPGQQRQRSLRNGIAVGQVGKTADPVAKRRAATVAKRHRDHVAAEQ
jgi:hypothetical protein